MAQCDFNITDNVLLALTTTTMFGTDDLLSGDEAAAMLQPVKINQTHLTLVTIMSFQSVRVGVLGMQLKLVEGGSTKRSYVCTMNHRMQKFKDAQRKQ